MPVQDDLIGNATMSTVVTEEENHLLDDEEDNVSVVSSQGKRRQANFTSPMYHQEELLNHGDVTDFSPTSPFVPHMPGVTPRATPCTTLAVSPKETLQLSPR